MSKSSSRSNQMCHNTNVASATALAPHANYVYRAGCSFRAKHSLDIRVAACFNSRPMQSNTSPAQCSTAGLHYITGVLARTQLGRMDLSKVNMVQHQQ